MVFNKAYSASLASMSLASGQCLSKLMVSQVSLLQVAWLLLIITSAQLYVKRRCHRNAITSLTPQQHIHSRVRHFILSDIILLETTLETVTSTVFYNNMGWFWFWNVFSKFRSQSAAHVWLNVCTTTLNWGQYS